MTGRERQKLELIKQYAPLMVQSVVTLEDDIHDKDNFVENYRSDGVLSKSNYEDSEGNMLSCAEGIAEVSYLLAEALAERILPK